MAKAIQSTADNNYAPAERRFISVEMTDREFEVLVRLIGHHTTGNSLNTLYERMVDKYPMTHKRSEDKGPLRATGSHMYGDRPMIDSDTF